MRAHQGRRIRIPASRRLSWDLLWFNRVVPQCGHDRRCDLREVAMARAVCPVRISWSAIFVRTFGLVAEEIPELRQTWYRWPWAHLYQHPESVASITVHRSWREEAWLFWGQIRRPEKRSLREIQVALDRFRDGPVKKVFRRQLQFVRLPTLLRRAVWWWNLNLATSRRATRVGTFFLSTLSGRGVEIQVPPSVHTCCLTFGPLSEDGECRVTLAYDHRVMDGVLVADVLLSLDSMLKTRIVSELRELAVSSIGEPAA